MGDVDECMHGMDIRTCGLCNGAQAKHDESIREAFDVDDPDNWRE